MSVILRKATHPHNPVQCPRGFIAVATAKFGHPQGQIAIGLQALIEDLNVTGAVHRLQGVYRFFARVLFVNLDDKHVFLVFIPVA